MLSSIASFCSFALEGRVSEEVRPSFSGATLVALEKKSKGVVPRKEGGICGGAEAAVHAARKLLQNLKMSMPW